MNLLDQLVSPVRIEDASRADLVLAMLSAALTAADPEYSTRRALADWMAGPATILALGKAAPAMVRGATTAIGAVEHTLIVTDHAEEVPPGAELIVTSHPIPDTTSEFAGRRLLDEAAKRENTVFLISGGGSALAEVPAAGLTLSDVAETYVVLLRAGLAIDEVNTVRSHLSALKGGRLAAAAGGPILTVLISDVIGGPHLIASGPTVPCPTEPGDALDVLRRRELTEAVPPQVLTVLAAGEPPPRIPASEVIVATDGEMAARGALDEAHRRRMGGRLVTPRLEGAAVDAVRWALAQAKPGEVSLFSGETTVEVRGAGRGGRNQQAALAAALVIENRPTVFAAFGTDGIDGPTDAAGAIVDGSTAGAVRRAGIDPEEALADNDSYHALDAAGALIRCGPTGTNVADLWIVAGH